MTAYLGMSTKTVQLAGHGGDAVDAYVATPDTQASIPGVVVIHHMPGWDEWNMEVTRRLAHHGIQAICPNLFHRMGDGELPDVVQRYRDAGAINDAEVLGDLQAAVDHLLASPVSNGKIGVIGFCSGGRIAYMAAAKLDVQAAVDCWGAGVTVPPGDITDFRPEAVIDMTAQIRCPVLGVFGNDDQNPSPEQVDAIEAELNKHGKNYEFLRYDGAGHGFWGWQRPGYRQEQAVDSWAKVFAFYEKHLGAAAQAARAG